MPATSPRSRHTLSRAENAKGGANGKGSIKVSIKKKWERILAGDLPKEVVEALKQNSFVSKDGKLVNAPIKTFSKNALESFALVGLYRALKDSDKLYELIQNTIDGPVKQEIELSVNGNDKESAEFIQKHNLLKRGGE